LIVQKRTKDLPEIFIANTDRWSAVCVCFILLQPSYNYIFAVRICRI
jgi:hypothetical protein